MSLEAAAYNEARLARIAAEAGKAPALSLSVPFFQSGTWIAPQDGIVEVRAIGAGGGGGKSQSSGSSTGGYSGAWGAKVVKVVEGQSITFNIGAKGVGSSSNAAGGNGGNTTVVIAGVTRTAPGGPGGVRAASGTPTVPDGPSLPAGDWDFGAASVKPGAVGTAAGITGGAGVDILAQGANATTSASVNSSGGGGTGAASSGIYGGGAMPSVGNTAGANANGVAVTAAGPGLSLDSSRGEFLISFYGGGGGIGAGGHGGNGGGGSGDTGGGNGGNGGGGGAYGGNGGLGGGGGASNSAISGGFGGNGYACLHFYPTTGV